MLGSSADLDPAVVRQFFRIIDEQADHMHDLVADLLDVARIETGTLPVTPEPAEVAVLVDRARSAFSSAGGRNNLAIDIPPDLPLVMADRRRVIQIVGNLLSNAAKHSSESSVITVTVVREDVHVAVSVADEGRGIPSERLPYLFRKFTRTDGDDLGSGVAGSGLGLAICKGIVEAHGGRIWAESEGAGMGARFTFTIPTVEGTGSGTAIGLPPLSTSRRPHMTERYTGPSAKRIADLLRHRVSFERGWFWTTTAICHGGKSDGLAFRQRPDGNGIDVHCHTGGCSAGVVITELEALIGLPIWTAYEPVRDAAAKAPEKRPWWKRQRVWAPTVVALVVAAPLITGDVELFVLNLVGLGTGALLLRRFMPRRPVGRVRRR